MSSLNASISTELDTRHVAFLFWIAGDTLWYLLTFTKVSAYCNIFFVDNIDEILGLGPRTHCFIFCCCKSVVLVCITKLLKNCVSPGSNWILIEHDVRFKDVVLMQIKLIEVRKLVKVSLEIFLSTLQIINFYKEICHSFVTWQIFQYKISLQKANYKSFIDLLIWYLPNITFFFEYIKNEESSLKVCLHEIY